MIYFDNAATGGFKPRAVLDATETTLKYLSANPGRSGHRLAVTGAEIVFNCRQALASLVGGSPERIVFTKNCTEALNLGIFGTVKTGGHVITTVYEHNSVLRPLYALKSEGVIELDVVDDKDLPLARAIEEKIKPNTYLIVCTAVSNVTGKVLPIKEIASVAVEKGLLFLVDGAQGGGHIPLSLSDGINMIAFAGHKGLYGVMGSGALAFDGQTEIKPLIYGGTGTESFNLFQPKEYPECLESGTLNLPTIAGLSEGIKYVEKNAENFGELLTAMTKKTIDALALNPKIKVYSAPNPAGIVAFAIENLPSAEAADILNTRYDVAVRSGLHCAPLMHKFLGTEKDGLIRASFAVQNSSREINYFLSSIAQMTEG